MQRSLVALVMVFASSVACTGAHSRVAPELSGRAAAQSEIPDNPLLASVPEETPYAFATFRPLPVELFEQMTAMYRPMFARAMTADNEETAKLRALADEVGTFSVQRFEELGFSIKARMVVYGLGVYPVLRLELRDGDALLAFIQRVAARWGTQLPAPVDERGRKVWRLGDAKAAVIIAVAKSELVLAVAPPAELDHNRALILGEQKPSRSISTAVFRDIARRDGYGTQSVGFVELPRFVTAVIAAAGNQAPPAACTSAIVGLARRVPRLTVGYDEMTRKHLSGGMVLELAPDLLAEAKKLSVKLAGIDRLNARPALFGFAVAADLVQARRLVGKAATAVRGLADGCAQDDLAAFASKLDAVANQPLPPFLEGLTGGIAVLTSFEIGKGGPKKLEGWGVVRMADTSALLALASREAPSLELKADGIARALPEGAGLQGAVAASHDAVAFALGTESERTAAEALRGTPAPAPLVMMQIDVGRMMDAAGEAAQSSELNATMHELYKAYGASTLTLDVDDRGLVGWGSFELR